MKKLFVLFLILSPIQLWAENSILDKYITITDNIITANVMSAAKELSFDKSIAKKYTAAGNTLEIEMNKDIGLLLSCNPTKNNIVKGTVIREKESKRIKAFKCGGDVDMKKVDEPSAKITYIAYNNLYKYNIGTKITEDFVYRRATNNQDPALKLKRYEKDDGEKDTLVSYEKIIVIIEKPAIERFK